MSDATYGFFSVLRRGVAAMIPADAPTQPPRIALPVSFSVAEAPVPAIPALLVRGPGDVIGLDARTIRRTWPKPDAEDAEPNYFPLVELADPDLPWRYTPAASSGDRLVPWLCLIVLEEREIAALHRAPGGRPSGAVIVSDAAALPNLAQSWAWAHAQIVGGPDAPATDYDANAVTRLLSSAPTRFVARLLCLRRLEPLTRYLACVVPTFEHGRLAGLGQATTGVDRSTPAWTSGAGPVTLPVYFNWRFRTGEEGDFASLVAKLQPAGDLPDEVWRRDFAVSPSGVHPPDYQVVGAEGALRTLDAASPAWPTIDEKGFTAALLPRVNVAATTLAPTLYGRWLAAANRLSSAGNASPRWFHQLNGDPRTRVAAGLGTRVVQREQQELLAAAWAQVDEIRRVNERLRLAQFAREVSLRVYQRHLAVADAETFVQITAPVHAKLRSGSITVHRRLTLSPIAIGALEPMARRVVRPLGSLAARQRRDVHATPLAGVLTRMSRGALSIVPPPPAPPPDAGLGALSLGALAVAFKRANVRPDHLHTVSVAANVVIREQPRVFGPPTPPIHPPLHPPVPPLVTDPHPPIADPLHAAPPPIVADPHPETAPPIDTATFQSAASTLMAQLARPALAGEALHVVNLDIMRSTLAAALHPRETIEKPLRKRLTGVVDGPRRSDPIEPVMVGPDFPQGMFDSLKAISQAWLIPGLDHVLPNTVAMLATNWPFVESFLVGLNHEMARKLLWNGYPTDQRGTYFRRFWDTRGGAGREADADIGPIHAWSGALGKNRLRAIDPLVLLIRGDVIRRYPNAIVYAARSESDVLGRRPGATEKHPLFFGRLDPDVALFGFDLDPVEARGNPGWFFVLQEHPSEPRFGLVPSSGAFGSQPARWQALAWNQLATDAAALAAIRHVDLDAALPQNPVTPDPTGAVWHGPDARSADLAHITLRQPSRLAVHGSMLIPPGIHS
jgi:hypothetical protein